MSNMLAFFSKSVRREEKPFTSDTGRLTASNGNTRSGLRPSSRCGKLDERPKLSRPLRRSVTILSLSAQSFDQRPGSGTS